MREAEADLKAITGYMLQNGESLAVAESVTSGYIQWMLSSAESATRFFQGGITVYNLHQKVYQLGINPMVAIGNNCVSHQVAQEMAEGVIRHFASDWGLAITGYANPIPDHGITHLFAFYSIAHRGKHLFTGLLSSKKKKSIKAQEDFAKQTIHHFARFLQNLTTENKDHEILELIQYQR